MIGNILISLECQNETQSLATQWSNHLDACLSSHGINNRDKTLHLIDVIDYRLAVQGQHHILAFFQMHLIHHRRTLHTLLQESDIVDKHITYHINLGKLSSLFVGYTIIGNTSGKENIRKTIYHKSIDFLWHRNIKTAGSCSNMSQLNALLLGYDSNSHSRSKIIYNNNYIRKMTLQITLELSHYHTRQFIHILAIHLKENVRTLNIQV